MRTEEDIAKECAAMETQLANEFISMMENTQKEDVSRHLDLMNVLLTYFADTMRALGKCDAQFLETHTVLILNIPYFIETSTVTRMTEEGQAKLHIAETSPDIATDMQAWISYLYIIDGTIENESQIVFNQNEDIDWIPNQ